MPINSVTSFSSTPSPCPLPAGERVGVRGSISDLSFLEIIQSERPLEIEIGCGKGRFLFGQARRYPEINFLGIDRVAKWMKKRAGRVEKEGLNHLKFIKADAREILNNHVPSYRVSVFYVYFPDPWAKRRHKKRRLVTSEFLALLHDRLASGGQIQMATDDEDYFLGIKKAVSLSGIEWRGIRESSNQRFGEPLEKTNYEMKFEAQKKNIYYLELTK